MRTFSRHPQDPPVVCTCAWKGGITSEQSDVGQRACFIHTDIGVLSLWTCKKFSTLPTLKIHILAQFVEIFLVCVCVCVCVCV